jgi:hypothetical protein
VVVLSHFKQVPQIKSGPFPFISIPIHSLIWLPFGVTDTVAKQNGAGGCGLDSYVSDVSSERDNEPPGSVKCGPISQRD